MKPDSLIFDLDGTLWNMNHVYLSTWQEVLKTRFPAVNLQQEDIDRVIGLDFDTALAKMLPELIIEDKQALAQEAFDIQRRLLEAAAINLYPGVEAGIRELFLKYRLFIVSNCDAKTIPVFLKKSGLEPFFEDWRSHGQSGVSKDQNLSNLRKEYQLKSPVYIGDTHSDHTFSAKAKMEFWQVWYGFGLPIPGVRGFGSFSDILQFLSRTF